MANIQHSTSFDLMRNLISTELGHNNGVNLKPPTTKNAQTKTESATLILALESLTQTKDSQTGEVLYRASLKPLLFMSSDGQSRTLQASKLPELQFNTRRELLIGELYAALGQVTGDQELKIQVQTAITAIPPDIKAKLALSEPNQQAPMTDSQLHKTANRAIARLHIHVQQALSLLAQHQTKVHQPSTPSLDETMQVVQSSRSSAPPLTWLSDNEIPQGTAPDWVKKMPQIAQRLLHDQNIKLIQSLVKSAAPHIATGTSEPGSVVSRQTNTTSLIYSALQSWTNIQQAWLHSPTSLAIHPQASFNDLSIVSSLAHQLYESTAMKPSSLHVVHQLLQKLSPAYQQATSILNEFARHSPLDASSNFNYATPQTPQSKILHTILAQEPQLQEPLIKALLLRSGLATLETSLTPPETSRHEQPQSQFILPYGHQSDLQQWLTVKTQTQTSGREEDSRQPGQKITLDFETEAFGFIRFELQFPDGFHAPQCASDIWLERTQHLPSFRKYESQLKKNLEKLGLQPNGFAWHNGRPEESMTERLPKYQIDHYV